MKKFIFVSFIFLMSLQLLSAQNRSKFRVNYSNSEQSEKSFNTISFAKNGGKDQYSITTESEKSYNDKFDISKIKSITRDREINISVLEGDELNNAIHDAIISENSIDEIIQSLKTNVNIDEVIKDHSKNILVLEKGDSVYTVFPTVDYEDPFNDDENENLSRAIASRTSWKETGKYGKVAVFNYFSGMSERKGQNNMVEDLMSLLNEHDYGVEYYDYDHFTKENLDKVINDSKYNNAYKAVLIFSHGFVNDGEGKHNGYPDDPWIVLGEEYKRSKHGAKMAENERYKWYNFESRNNGAYRVKEIDCNRNCILYIGACNALEGYHKGDKYCPVIGWDGVNVLSQAHALMIFHRMLNNEASLVNALKSTWSFDKIVESDWVSSVVSDNTNGIFFLGNPDKDYGYSLYNVVSKVYLDKPGTDEIFFRRGNPIDLYPSYKLKFQGHITYEGDDCPKRLWVRIKPVGRKGTGINAKLKIKKDGSFDSSMKLSNGMNGMYDIIIGEKKDFGLNEIVEMESYRTFVYSSKFKENSASTLDYFTPDHIDIIDDNNSKVSSLSLKQGESKTLYIDDDDPEEKYLVSSSDPTVAKVSVDGTELIIEALKEGSTTITVHDEDEYVNSTINVSVEGKEESPSGLLSCPDDNHPHAIDLGLPSGTKWSCCNLGASKPEEFGGYFAWGEIKAKDYFDWSTYQYGNSKDDLVYLGDDISGTQYDAATMNWGDKWRMPTFEQFYELVWCSRTKWTNQNGVDGLLFSGYYGGKLFLPAAGYVWIDELQTYSTLYYSSELAEGDNSRVWSFSPDDRTGIDGVTGLARGSRLGGYPIRPVAK